MIISSDMISKIGITANDKGTSCSLIGAAAISEIKIVDTSSEISSSPICRNSHDQNQQYVYYKCSDYSGSHGIILLAFGYFISRSIVVKRLFYSFFTK